ncbi:SDR family NAD(P)-dependent oxidoreductase [Muricoccus radiodurans]|uniref:SDR family NAD(P)-dependent oxidoreductase n=1 Tax=Muricoccus radiodurans TaxID=2231721 RepID=UPI003CEAA846
MPRPLALALLAILVTACAPVLRDSDRGAIAGRTYVVTGASSGFGRGVAERLGSMGANVVLAARRGAVLEEVAGRVRAGGGQALVVPTDVAELDQVERLARAAEERFGHIDVWVNNAAVGAIGRFEEIPLTDHARVVQVNLNGTIHGSHAALRRFRAQGFGTLVNISSVEARVPLAYHASYAATKAGILALGTALNEELRLNGLDDRLRVVSVLPWAADTPFWDHAGNYSGRSPRGFLMDDGQEVADAIVWVSVNPRPVFAVGWKAEAAVLGSHLAPVFTERMAGNLIHRAQIENPPPAPPTPGAIHAPVMAGTGVDGGTRARIAREDAARP